MKIGNVKGSISSHTVADQCPICTEMSEIQVNFRQKVFFFGLPMFPHEKFVEIECKSCKQDIPRQFAPKFVSTYIDREFLKAPSLKWAYSGAVIMALVFVFGTITMLKDASKMKAYIQDPVIGDRYIINYEDKSAVFNKERYTIWLLVKKSTESLFFVESHIEINDIEDKGDLMSLSSLDVWDYEDTLQLAKVELTSWTNITAEPKRIEEIVRKE